MSLLTRCPRCNTLFRVLPTQLQARGGQVRCGRCMHVFDGFQMLSGEGAPASEESPAGPASAPAARLSSASEAPSAASTPLAAMPNDPFAPTAAEAEHSHGTRRIVVCAALAVVLLAQLAYLFRGELAARSSLMKTAFTTVCRAVGCTIALPQRPDLVKIEASDLNMIDKNRPALIQLTATLRSYADHDLAYPALDLVLTNATEHALARRIFLPEEYLASRDAQAGMPARAEITVALDLDTGNLNAAGFRLDLLPAR